MKIRVLLAASTDLFLLGTKAILQPHPSIEVVAATQQAAEVLRLPPTLSHDVLLFDSEIDPEGDILTLLARLRLLSPQSKRVLIGNQSDGYYVQDVLAAGVQGYLYQYDDLKRCLPLAIEWVQRDRLYLSPTPNAEYLIASQAGSRRAPLDPETLQVLRLLAQGQHFGQVAVTMGISRRRVYSLCEKLRRRFSAHTNEHMMTRAAAEGLLRSEDSRLDDT